jgi:sulfite reductase (NADPH) hemoprotein beta-component
MSHEELRRRPSYADPAEIDQLVEMLGRFERGEIDAEAWRAFRVVRGVYGQRQEGVHMLRVKIPQGVATAAQLRALADVGRRWSRGFGHVTTRQNFQFHFVRPADLDAALRRLADAGLTTMGAGGNAVRNVVACSFAGVAADEVFDVTPYAEAATRHFLRHPLASSLPRKFKVGFEGCAEDHVATPLHDLGFRARVDERGRRGFSVTLAGGTATLLTSGEPLLAFLPAERLLALAEAVVRVFHARGDRQNRKRNRLKFLVRDLGFPAFRALVEEALAQVVAEGAPALPFDPDLPPEELPPVRAAAAPAVGAAALPVVGDASAESAALAAFRAMNVRAQRQPGWSAVTVSPPQGDLTSAQLEALASLATRFGDGSVRLTGRGHALLRWVRDEEVAALHAALAAAGLGRGGAGTAGDVASCPGSDACTHAVTHARGIARAVEERVRARGGAPLATDFPVRVSGCPNGCSLHHAAAIGLQGSLRKVGGRAAPHYLLFVGGGVGPSGARFAENVGRVPARRVPEAVERLVALYLLEAAPGESAGEFLHRRRAAAAAAIADLLELTAETAREEDFVDPGLEDEAAPGGDERAA